MNGVIFRKNRSILPLSLLLLGLDQLSKYHIANTYSLHESRPIFSSCFSITYVLNTGSIFGFFQNFSAYLAYLGLITSLLLLLTLWKWQLPHFCSKLAYSCILAGILGNTLDRFLRPGVVDFLDFYYKNHHWPCFNFADIYICCACVYFIFIKK